MSKEKFNDLAEQAAHLERSGDNYGANLAWLKALAYSNSEANREWCKARADFCQSMRWAR